MSHITVWYFTRGWCSDLWSVLYFWYLAWSEHAGPSSPQGHWLSDLLWYVHRTWIPWIVNITSCSLTNSTAGDLYFLSKALLPILCRLTCRFPENTQWKSFTWRRIVLVSTVMEMEWEQERKWTEKTLRHWEWKQCNGCWQVLICIKDVFMCVRSFCSYPAAANNFNHVFHVK